MHWQHPHVPHHNGFPQRVDHNPPVDIDNGQNDDDCYGDKECLLKSLHSIINVTLVLFAMIVDAVGPGIFPLIVVDVIQRLTSFVASFTVCFRHLIGDNIHKELKREYLFLLRVKTRLFNLYYYQDGNEKPTKEQKYDLNHHDDLPEEHEASIWGPHEHADD